MGRDKGIETDMLKLGVWLGGIQCMGRNLAMCDEIISLFLPEGNISREKRQEKIDPI